MKFIFFDHRQHDKKTELARLRDLAIDKPNDGTSDLWQYIFSSTFRGERWRVETDGSTLINKENNSIEIRVYRSTQSTEPGPFLVWRGRQPKRYFENRDDIEGDLKKQGLDAGLLQLKYYPERHSIWIMTSIGASAKLWVLRSRTRNELKPKLTPVPTPELTPVWPDEVPVLGSKPLTCLHNPQNPIGVPFWGPGSRYIEEEEMIHGPITSEGLGRIPEWNSSQQRAVHVMRAGRELFGPEDAVGHGRELEYRWSQTGCHDLHEVHPVPNAYNDIKTYPGHYEDILAHIKKNPDAKFFVQT
ncbi:hypothetical protein LEL_04724 [Akanthomyces lecanii RCEF 1005]|uniref:Uncharacterized protein n=1 Tax=Akanthomyces lecanii RCEF 1005 TaxID=1081108 RepID=A0A168HKJ1_CORDF|nr:hypothetical protein LEL_04724 [Akanthomyces lecanii RCEF 1005]